MIVDSRRRSRVVQAGPALRPGQRLPRPDLRRQAGTDVVAGVLRRRRRLRSRCDQRHRLPADRGRPRGQRSVRRPARVQAHAAGDGADRGRVPGALGRVLDPQVKARDRVRLRRPGDRRQDRARRVPVGQPRPHPVERLVHDVPPKARAAPFDYFHLNSIDQDSDGNLVISARSTSAVYKIDHSTGKVIWTLGGRYSSFKLGAGAATAFQHDVRVRSTERHPVHGVRQRRRAVQRPQPVSRGDPRRRRQAPDRPKAGGVRSLATSAREL